MAEGPSEDDEPKWPTPRASLRPKLRLFLSADIVGSTAFKQRNDDGADAWFALVRNFYPMAESTFDRHWQLAKQRYPTSAEQELLFGDDAPELWKTVGDEVLFTKRITDPAQTMMCMYVWLRVLSELRSYLKKPRSKGLLDVKSSAWLADFPVRNREVVLRTRLDGDDLKKEDDELDWLNESLIEQYEKNPENLTRDFIGQSIDTGFRLGAAATTRQLILSIELAHMLSLECQNLDKPSYHSGPIPPRGFTFRYGGAHSLKGVMNGTPYPHIWIDTDPEKPIHVAEDALTYRPKPTPAQIYAFTEAFITRSPGKFCTQLRFLAATPEAYEVHENDIYEKIEKMEDRVANLELANQAREESIAQPEDDPSEAPPTLNLSPPKFAGGGVAQPIGGDATQQDVGNTDREASD